MESAMDLYDEHYQNPKYNTKNNTHTKGQKYYILTPKQKNK